MRKPENFCKMFYSFCTLALSEKTSSIDGCQEKFRLLKPLQQRQLLDFVLFQILAYTISKKMADEAKEKLLPNDCLFNLTATIMCISFVALVSCITTYFFTKSDKFAWGAVGSLISTIIFLCLFGKKADRLKNSLKDLKIAIDRSLSAEQAAKLQLLTLMALHGVNNLGENKM